jgi:hypothetical protein
MAITSSSQDQHDFSFLTLSNLSECPRLFVMEATNTELGACKKEFEDLSDEFKTLSVSLKEIEVNYYVYIIQCC